MTDPKAQKKEDDVLKRLLKTPPKPHEKKAKASRDDAKTSSPKTGGEKA